MTRAPNHLYSHETCLRVAERLRDDRAAGDPGFVSRGKLTADAAAERAACSEALVILWRHLVEVTTFDIWAEDEDLGVTWGQLRRDLATTAETTQRRAQARPEDRAARYIADVVARMAWWFRDGSKPVPNFIFCHDCNVRERTARGHHRRAA